MDIKNIFGKVQEFRNSRADDEDILDSAVSDEDYEDVVASVIEDEELKVYANGFLVHMMNISKLYQQAILDEKVKK